MSTNNLNNCTELEKIAMIWQLQLNLEYCNTQKNVRLAFRDIGSFAEFLALDFCENYTGSGSGGMGLDLVNRESEKAIEVKSCCLIQNAKCSKCGTKYNDLFAIRCPVCGSKDHLTPKDSRFGISTSELLQQIERGIFDCFIMCCLKQENHDSAKKEIEFELEWFKIDFDDKKIRDIQLDYFKNQKAKGKKDHCNLLPYSFDFYKLCPKKLSTVTIRINYSDLNKSPIVVERLSSHSVVRVPKSVLKSKEIDSFESLSTYDAKTETADAVDFALHIPYRVKTLGKNRGDTRNKVYGAALNSNLIG